MKPDMILFPDGSLKMCNEKRYAGYGSVILDPHKGKYITINGRLNSKSIVYCEGWAVYKSFIILERIRKRKKIKHLRVLVISDSKLTVQTFNEWILYAWDTSDWYNWKKNSGEAVKNQELYRSILNIITNGHYRVKFIHINSHSNKKKNAIDKIKSKLTQAKVTIDDQTLNAIIEMNRLADEAATAITSKDKDDDIKGIEWIDLIHRETKGDCK